MLPARMLIDERYAYHVRPCWTERYEVTGFHSFRQIVQSAETGNIRSTAGNKTT